jgi:hypothetical protein
MFTSVKHSTLKENINNIISVCFKNSGKQYLWLDGNKVSYTNDSSLEVTYRKEDLFELVEVILENNFVTFAEYNAKQIKGVPMGLPCSPKMIDLAMAFAEYKYLTNPVNRDVARKIGNNTCRYVDDFCTFTELDITQYIGDIYPAELKLNKTSHANHSTFLDTSIHLVNNRLQLSVYNKTDDFPFTVIKYGHPDSNVHSSSGYNTFYGELMRFARISNNTDSFIDRCRLLVNDFVTLGYEMDKLYIAFFKFINRNKTLSIKHGITNENEAITFLQTILA